MINQWCKEASFKYIQYRSIITSFLYAWCHTVFRVLIPKICREIYISTRHDMALPRVVFTRDVEFTRDGNVTFSRDEVVLIKLSNWQDSTCL